LLSLVRIARGAPLGTYARLGVFTAAAVATKDQAYGLFLLLPIPLAALHGAVRDRRLIAAGVAALVTYVVAANVLVDPHGWLAHLYYITHEGSRPYQMYPATLAGHTALAAHVARLVVETATPPVVLLAAFGLAAIRPAARRGVLLLGCAALSYLATFVGPILYVFPRFVLPLVFVSAILGGVGGAALWARAGRVGRVAVAGSVAFVFLYGTSMNLGLVWDSRYEAEAWLAEHVPAGALVGTNGEGVYLPRVPAELRTVAVEVTSDGLRFDGDPPDYLVLSDAYYARYLRRAGVRPVFLALLDGEEGYERVATFQSPHLAATNLIPTMNPRIVVLRRRSSAYDSGAREAVGHPRRFLELAERPVDREHEVVQVGDQVPIGDESPAELAGVAEQRDAERLVREERQHRVALTQLGAEQIERDLRPRHVRHHEVERPRPGAEPNGE
jgi:hypothetical protein